MKRFDEAAIALEKSLEINPFNPIPYAPLLNIYDKKGDKDRAEMIYRDFQIISGLKPEAGVEIWKKPVKE